ncbi:MAG: site-specific integrase [Brevundimonas sp.]|uniref:tyrosine-type recombinase/integrase n=1 Tax=Brevundimonas sp. TaxID=1871086 RepID=UPI00122609CD|nr:site-specific integrase [Brevundimonas sp.]RZJ19089.1 MAG: site-specific integrase [Brevundimonas sp.]
MEKVPHVQRIKRSSGRVDLYFRKGDFREGPLRSADNTPELKAEVGAILARIEATIRAATPKAGTVGAMLRQYNKSAEFLALARSTQRAYQRLIDEIDADAGDVMAGEVTAGWVRDMRDAWAVRGYKAANDRLQVLKNALEPAIDDGRIPDDPFARLKKVRRPHDSDEAHPTWEDAEVAAVIELAIARKMPGLARAVALGRWGGFRRGTICNLPLNARTRAINDDGLPERRIYWVTEKRKVLVDAREDARLTALLARTPDKALTIAYNRKGEVWKERQLNQAIDRMIETLAKDQKVRPNLTIHGLRHARGVELALAGATDGEIMSQLGHATDRAAKIYRRQADRRRMADAAQNKIDNVVKLRATRRA